MRSVVLDCGHDRSLRSVAWTRLREEEFISAGKAFLSVLAVAEGDDLDYVQSKLLPHKLSFERYPYTIRDSSQAAHADRSSYLVTPRAYADTSQGSNSGAEPSDDGFVQHTARGDYYAADGLARADAETLVCRDLDDTEALTGSCNALNTRPSVHARSSEMPTGQTTAEVSFTAQTHSTGHALELENQVFYEHTFQADYAGDFRSSSPLDTTTYSDRNTGTASAHHGSHEHRPSDEPSFLSTSGIARQNTLKAPACEVLAHANNMKWPFPIPMDRHSLPTYAFSAATSLSPSYSSPTPQAERDLIWPEGAPQTPYARCVQQLDALHPDVQKHISSIIELGDSLFQEDIVTFVKSFCRQWSRTNLSYRPMPNRIAGEGSMIDNMVSHYYHAEVFRRHSVVDRLKLRFLRILLYQHFEELLIDIRDNSAKYGLLPSAQDAASFATDQILDKFNVAHKENVETQTSQQKRQRFRRHKSIGKRWSLVASHFGLGIFLICSSALEARLNDHKFSERRLAALVTYVRNVYPRGSQLGRELDPFVLSIIRGIPPTSWPTTALLSQLGSYKQEDERASIDLSKEWSRIDSLDVLHRIL